MAELSDVDLATRLRQSMAALEKAEEHAAAGQFALEVMHEIRNPLETLGNLIFLALESSADSPPVQQYLKLAEEQLATLRFIAHQALGFARTSVTPKPVDLVAIAEAAVRIHQPRINAQQIHLVKSLPDKLFAEVHTGQILQVVSNLIGNAVEALPPQGTIHLRLRKNGDRIQMLVSDNGQGIPPNQLSSIFQPYFTTKVGVGTGLGLALSKRIVDHHRGSLKVRSCVTPGKTGTSFRICIPLLAS